MDKGIYGKILEGFFHSCSLNSNNKSGIKIPVTFPPHINPLLLDVITPKKPVIQSVEMSLHFTKLYLKIRVCVVISETLNPIKHATAFYILNAQ